MKHFLLSRRLWLSVALAGTLAACDKPEAPAASAASGAVDAPATSQVVRVASNAAFAPFEYVTPAGKVEGFDVDVLTAAAAKGGFEVQFVDTPWEGIFTTLDSGEAGIVASGVTITDARRESMEFSEPYFDAVQLIALKPDSTVESLAGLKELTIGVLNASTGDEVVSKMLGKTSPNIKRFESLALALKELESGGVAAVVGDNGVVRHYLTNNKANFKLVDDRSFETEKYGFALKKGNTELTAKVNAGLQAIRADGTYDQIYAKWFGAAPDAAPQAAAAASASAPAEAASDAAPAAATADAAASETVSDAASQ